MDEASWLDAVKTGWLLYSILKEIYKYLTRKSPKPKSKRKRRKHKGKRH